MLDVRERLAADDLPERLTLLGFREDDRGDAVAAAAAVLQHPAEAAEVQTMAERLVLAVGAIGDPWDGSLPWPWRAEGTDSVYGPGVLELLALLTSVDEVRTYHASRGIGGDASWRALSDLGQQVFVHRLTYGGFGLHTHDWLRVAWSGALYWLGRLQFNLQRHLQETGDLLETGDLQETGDLLETGDPVRDDDPSAGSWVLSTHIPRSGPLTPSEVDASFAAARRFFAEHFAEFSLVAFHCHSWLLDPELAAALPATSNMAMFQRRWALTGEPGIADEDAVFFTFTRRPPVDLASLPRDTTLQRAIIDRLADGGHWHVWHGLIPCADDFTGPDETSEAHRD